MNNTRLNIFRISAVLILVGVAALAFARQVWAASASITVHNASADPDCTNADFSATGTWSGGTGGYTYWVIWRLYLDGIEFRIAGSGITAPSGSFTVGSTSNVVASRCEVEFTVLEVDTNTVIASSGRILLAGGSVDSSQWPPPPPGVWLAHVCEPEDGFSTPEYGQVITLGSDANAKPYGTTLYIGTSIDGPWTATEFTGPSYIVAKPQIEALTESMGLEDYHDLWLRIGDPGIPANLGSMIIDREAVMDSLCSPE